VNLMPKKIQTETQILRLISKSPIQVTCDFMRISSHESKNTAADHLVTFYSTFDDFKDKNYDGLIVTGAPIEDLKYEDVDYWDEFCRIVDWAQEHVFSTMYLCWGALAGLYYLHDIPKKILGAKLFGIFPQRLCDEYCFLTNGFDEGDFHEIFVTGHFEYDRDTLAEEYWRDFHKGLPIRLPENYFPDNDPEKQPLFTWRAHANLLYRNWINWVYQMTPYNTDEIPAAIADLRQRVSEADPDDR